MKFSFKDFFSKSDQIRRKLEEIHEKLENVCSELHVHFVDNGNIRGFNHFKDSLYLLESRKRLLANNLLSNLIHFLSVMH